MTLDRSTLANDLDLLADCIDLARAALDRLADTIDPTNIPPDLTHLAAHLYALTFIAATSRRDHILPITQPNHPALLALTAA